MKNHELYIMKEGLSLVPDNINYRDENKKGIIEFKLGITKNKRMLGNHLMDIEKAIKPSEEYMDYQEKEQELSKKFCRKDKDGRNLFLPSIDERFPRIFDIIGADDPASQYSIRLRALKEKFKSAIEEQKKRAKKFNDFLEDESNFEPYLIPMDLVPEDIPQSAMDGVFFIIEDELKPEKRKKK